MPLPPGCRSSSKKVLTELNTFRSSPKIMKKHLLPHLANKTDIIWDWNGTLIDDRKLCVEVINSILTEEGLPALSMQQYLETFRFPVVEYYKMLGLGTDAASFEQLAAAFTERYRAGVRDCRLYPHVLDSLRSFDEQNIRQSILSAAKENPLKLLLKHYEIGHHFDHVYGLSDNYATSKIDRGRELLAKLDVATESIVLIGDTDHDAEVGRALGIDVVLIADGHQTAERLKKAHSRVIEPMETSFLHIDACHPPCSDNRDK